MNDKKIGLADAIWMDACVGDYNYSELEEQCDAVRQLESNNAELLEALEDILSGWRYIREVHGDLYGVGFDRAEFNASAVIAKAKGEPTCGR